MIENNKIVIDSWGKDVIDPLPQDLYIIEIGFINRIEYTTGKCWIDRLPVIEKTFFNLNKALDYLNIFKNKIVGKRYMFMYNFLEDGSKDYLHRSYGSLAYKDSRY